MEMTEMRCMGACQIQTAMGMEEENDGDDDKDDDDVDDDDA